jgi:hypothetical protein
MTQCDRILKYLKSGRGITTFQAYDLFQVTRLPDRVRDLRAKGHTVYAEMIRLDSGKRVARYQL